MSLASIATTTQKGVDVCSIRSDALALIKQQDEQIFALENRLKECENGYAGTLHLESCKLHDAEERVKELTEVNKEIQEVANTAVGSFIRLETLYKVECKRAETIKSDTVREIQERFKERIKGIYLDEHEANFILEQVGNELSNSKDCPDCKHFIGCEPSTAGVCDGFEKREEKRDD